MSAKPTESNCTKTPQKAGFLASCNFPPTLTPPDFKAHSYEPSQADCITLWDKYAMPDHIRAHSTRVGELAMALAARGEELGAIAKGTAEAAYSAGLLHDIAKLYCIEHGGSHAHIGGAWIMAETKNPAIAQAVTHHVWWPFDVDAQNFFLPLAVLYADKRVRHDKEVSLGARFSDLFERYGTTEKKRANITISMQQARAIEHALGELLKVKLHASTSHRGRLVF